MQQNVMKLFHSYYIRGVILKISHRFLSQLTETCCRRRYQYEVLQCGEVKKLIKERSSPEDESSYYVSIEDFFAIIQPAYIVTGHGGRDCLLKHLSLKDANITREAVELFKTYCITFQEKTKRSKTKGVTNDLNSRCQVNLIGMQSSLQAQNKWIMVYLCHISLSSSTHSHQREQLRLLFQLLDILLIGAPCIFQSDLSSLPRWFEN
ncbi:KRAB-A domain-containing protein 2-like [Palaemon carinicauda]|uniref:KRAB-A domain-containing protein 2-like n=1 Tax=Palaemon carinicauda TaxID=392227 RepID=UPI0035B6276F